MTTKRKKRKSTMTPGRAAPIAADDVGGNEELGVVDMVANETTENQVDPLASQPAAPAEPEDTAALFSRMGLAVDLDTAADIAEETSRDAALAPNRLQTTQQASGATGSNADAAGHAAEDAEDVEVAEYMKELLGRTQREESPQLYGEPEASPSDGDAATGQDSTASSPSSTNSSATHTGVASATSATGVSNTAHGRAVRSPRKPRPVTAPEVKIDLAAMRELANLSAQGALDTHSRQQLVQVTFTKLLLAVLSLVAGLGIVWFADSARPYTWMGASVCWTITVVFAAQYFCLVRVCYGHGNRRKKNQATSGDA